MSAIRPPRPYGLPLPVGPTLGRLSGTFGQAVILALVNRALVHQIEDGLADFLSGRVLGIAIPDLGITWKFTLSADGTRFVRAVDAPETVIRSDSGALLLLASRRMDPDTLFFHRRLSIEGDTELGLQAKNMLDTLETEDLPAPLPRILDHAGRMAERWS